MLTPCNNIVLLTYVVTISLVVESARKYSVYCRERWET